MTTTTRIRDIARNADARRIQNYIAQKRFRWSLENFDKNLAALDATLAKLKADEINKMISNYNKSDYKFYD